MSREPKRNVYVGHRYVPLVIGEWEKTETYEGLSIVTYQGTSYTSKKRVPKGIDILNEEYWVVTGNYDAQIEEYRKDVRELEKSVEKDINDLETGVNENIDGFKKDVNKNVNDFKTDVTKDINEFKETTNNKITKVETDTKDEMNVLKNETNDKINQVYNSSVYNNGISYTKHYHEEAETIYYLTRIPRRDPKTGKILKLKQYTDLKNNKIVEDFAKELNADFAINGGWGADDTTLEYVWIEDGEIKNNNPTDKPSRYTLGITEDGTLKSYHNTNAERLIDDDVIYAHTAFTPIIINGNKNNDVFSASSGLSERHPRQVIGQFKDKSLIILTTDGRGYNGEGLNSEQCADILYREGVDFAYMTDGGGSTQTVIRHQMINTNTNNTWIETDYRKGMGNIKRKRQSVLYIESQSNENKDEAIKQISNDVAILKNSFDLFSKSNYIEWEPYIYPIGWDGKEEQFNYQKQMGYSVRIGNLVFAYYHIEGNRIGDVIGNLRMGRLPYYPDKEKKNGFINHVNRVDRFTGFTENQLNDPYIMSTPGQFHLSFYGINNETGATQAIRAENLDNVEISGLFIYTTSIEDYN